MSRLSPALTLALKPSALNPVRGQFILNQDASLSTAGLIVDDRETAAAPGTTPLFTNGGTIKINAYRIDLESGGAIDVSGGVEMNAANKLAFGSGGTLTINAEDPKYSALGLLPGTTYFGQLLLNTTLKGYSGKANNGGTLSLGAPFIQIGGDQLLNGDSLSNVGRTLWLNELDANGNLLPFGQDGFSNITMTGLGDFALDASNQIIAYTYMPGFVVAPGATIAPQVSNWMAMTPVGGLALTPTLLPVGQRTPANLTFSSLGVGANFAANYISNNEGLRGDLVVYSGAVIQTDPLGSVALNTDKTPPGTTVTMLGSIYAPGGKISITGALQGDETTVPVFSQQGVPTVDLGPGSVLDASGTTVLTPDASGHGLRTGTVLPGGSIAITGNIVAEAGATLKVNGASDQLDVLQADTGASTAQSGNISGSNYVRVREDSNGGGISLTGNDELFTDATLSGFAGGSNLPGGSMAQGGTLSVSSSVYTGGAAISPTLPNLFLTQSGTPFYTAEQNVTLNNEQTVAVGGPSMIVTGPAGSVSGGPLVVGNPVVGTDGVTSIPGAGYFSADSFNNRGFGSLTLKGAVQFSGPVELNATNSLAVADGGILQADPTAGASSLTLTAAYVAVGEPFLHPVQPSAATRVFSIGSAPISGLPSFGAGSLAVNASDLIDIGNLSLQNIGTASFDATYDNGATGMKNGAIRGDGTLDVDGNISLTAGQIYAPTAVNFTIAAYNDQSGGESPQRQRVWRRDDFARPGPSRPAAVGGRNAEHLRFDHHPGRCAARTDWHNQPGPE